MGDSAENSQENGSSFIKGLQELGLLNGAPIETPQKKPKAKKKAPLRQKIIASDVPNILTQPDLLLGPLTDPISGQISQMFDRLNKRLSDSIEELKNSLITDIASLMNDCARNEPLADDFIEALSKDINSEVSIIESQIKQQTSIVPEISCEKMIQPLALKNAYPREFCNYDISVSEEVSTRTRDVRGSFEATSRALCDEFSELRILRAEQSSKRILEQGKRRSSELSDLECKEIKLGFKEKTIKLQIKRLESKEPPPLEVESNDNQAVNAMEDALEKLKFSLYPNGSNRLLEMIEPSNNLLFETDFLRRSANSARFYWIQNFSVVVEAPQIVPDEPDEEKQSPSKIKEDSVIAQLKQLQEKRSRQLQSTSAVVESLIRSERRKQRNEASISKIKIH